MVSHTKIAQLVKFSPTADSLKKNLAAINLYQVLKLDYSAEREIKVPSFSPITTRRRAPGLFMLNTRIGKL